MEKVDVVAEVKAEVKRMEGKPQSMRIRKSFTLKPGEETFPVTIPKIKAGKQSHVVVRLDIATMYVPKPEPEKKGAKKMGRKKKKAEAPKTACNISFRPGVEPLVGAVAPPGVEPFPEPVVEPEVVPEAEEQTITPDEVGNVSDVLGSEPVAPEAPAVPEATVEEGGEDAVNPEANA